MGINHRRSESGTFLILGILAMMIILTVMVAHNLLLRKHRERTTIGTIAAKSYFGARASQGIIERRILENAISPMWNSANSFSPFTIQIDTNTVVTVAITDQGF